MKKARILCIGTVLLWMIFLKSSSVTQSDTVESIETGTTQWASLSFKNIVYEEGPITISYPQVVMADSDSRQTCINDLLQRDALSATKVYNLKRPGAALHVDYTIKHSNKNRISVLYTGQYTASDAAYPIHIRYSTNINTVTTERLRFADIANVITVGSFLKSGEWLPQNSGDIAACSAATSYIQAMSEDRLIKLLNEADFSDESSFPSAFSYYEGKRLVISLAVPHAAGDYAEFKVPKNDCTVQEGTRVKNEL